LYKVDSEGVEEEHVIDISLTSVSNFITKDRIELLFDKSVLPRLNAQTIFEGTTNTSKMTDMRKA
jgi:hypothetical protein